MRNLILYGPDGWGQLMETWAQSQSLEPVGPFQCFEKAEQLETFINSSKQECVVLYAGSITAPILENMHASSSVLVVYGCNLASVLAASLFADQVDTLEELSETIVSQSRAAVLPEIANPRK